MTTVAQDQTTVMPVNATTAFPLQTTTENVTTTDMTTRFVKTTSEARVNMTTTDKPMTTGYRTTPSSNVTGMIVE